MFLIKSNNNKYLIKIYNLLTSQKLPFTMDLNVNSFACLFFKFDNNNLKIELSPQNEVVKFIYPVKYVKLIFKIIELLNKIQIVYADLNYIPSKQLIEFKKKFFRMGEIHNLILGNLILNQESGLSKIDLYKIIWPDDKEIHINKLDTHLTNLKNNLKINIDYNFQFSSKSGKLFIN